MMEQGILTGPEIREQLVAGRLSITPFDPECVNPASVDLTLGEHVAVYAAMACLEVRRSLGALAFAFASEDCLDARKENRVRRFEIPPTGLVLLPNILYLMHTAECIHTDHFVTVLDGKSSIGRLGIKVHETAGYIDPGFNGQPTLEVTCVHPVRVYAGMRFCQVRFHTMVGERELYGGGNSHYKGLDAEGPVPSMSWKQFKEPA